MPSQQTPKFRTPYRDKAEFATEGENSQSNGVANAMYDIGAAGDMLDAIGRSQKYSQQRRESQKKTQLKVKLRKGKTRRASTVYREPISRSSVQTFSYTTETPKTPPAKMARLENLRRQSSPVSVQEAQSSEIYDFPEPPNGPFRQNLERRFYKRLAERQVLRTIQKMSDEIQTFRRRLQQLRLTYVTFV